MADGTWIYPGRVGSRHLIIDPEHFCSGFLVIRKPLLQKRLGLFVFLVFNFLSVSHAIGMIKYGSRHLIIIPDRKGSLFLFTIT